MDIYIKRMIWTFTAALWVCTLCLQFLNHSGKHSFWSLKLWRVRFVELWNQLTTMVFCPEIVPSNWWTRDMRSCSTSCCVLYYSRAAARKWGSQSHKYTNLTSLTWAWRKTYWTILHCWIFQFAHQYAQSIPGIDGPMDLWKIDWDFLCVLWLCLKLFSLAKPQKRMWGS
jgi:hypothetical protein